MPKKRFDLEEQYREAVIDLLKAKSKEERDALAKEVQEGLQELMRNGLHTLNNLPIELCVRQWNG